MSADFLTQMAAGSRERVRQAMRRTDAAALRERALATPAPPALALSGRFDLIAELKLRSPAAGVLGAADTDPAAHVGPYARAGAAAVSVLTEPSRFDGSLEHLEAAAQALRPLAVPVMRKDFLVDPYQLLEARVAGAAGVLVIVRMLAAEPLAAMLAGARELGLFVLLEAFDEADLERAQSVAAAWPAGAPALLVGVNCRDLASLAVVPERLLALAAHLPGGVPRVAESGVGSAPDAARVARAGYDAVLVGSALMRAHDPGALAGEMLEAGRQARDVRS